jgi:hypothetical protein
MRSGIAMGWGIVLGLGLAGPAAAGPDGEPLTPRALRDRLEAGPSGAEADRLAEAVRSWFGKGDLPQGPGPKIDERDVAWAIEAPGAAAAPRVVSEDDAFRLTLGRIGATDVYAGTATLPEGTALRWAYEVDGARRPQGKGRDGRPIDYAPLEVYATHPDGVERPDVPKGTLTQRPKWRSEIFRARPATGGSTCRRSTRPRSRPA